MEENNRKIIKIIALSLAGFLFFALVFNAVLFGFWKKSGYLSWFERCAAGKIADIAGDNIFLAKENQNEVIKIGETTEIKIGGAKGDVQDLKKGQYVFIMTAGRQNMQAGVIRVFEKRPLPPPLKTLWELFSK